ncbi:MAG: hypothetical protein IJ856_04610 [Candidatus Methanomethylophilaceae archaeon]|nr:hypothetical protein [Candidatus Methanomethylophilaceae archaeon]
MTESASGNRHDIGRIMRILDLAVENGPDVDASFLEGLLAKELLRELGALCPDDAVFPEDIGYSRIPRFVRSGRSSELVAFTEDGRVYLMGHDSPL